MTEVLVALIAATGVLGAATIPSWLSRRKLNEIHDQTVNDHGKDGKDLNLRMQIDRLIELGEENRDMISGIHADMRVERKERREGDQTLREDINHRLSQIANRVDMLADG